jgi:hypothetical protein
MIRCQPLLQPEHSRSTSGNTKTMCSHQGGSNYTNPRSLCVASAGDAHPRIPRNATVATATPTDRVALHSHNQVNRS